ncbi:MAG: small conductance mechanosensitive channel [Planctomycetota bacterium]|jgi:small conductance mechanosensitive channel
MKHLLQFCAALLLLVAPVTATAPPTLTAATVVQTTAQSDAALATLKSADEANEAAKAAAIAAPKDEALAAAKEAAAATYDAALKDARKVRDGMEDDTEFATAIYEVSGAAPDMTGSGFANMVTSWTKDAKDYVVNEGPGMLISIVAFLFILFVFRVLSKVGANITKKALSGSKLNVSDLLKKFFVGIVGKLIFAVGFVIALGQLGVDTGPLLAGIGVVGFVIGFALQDTLSNFASGIMILLYRPYDIGDVIKAGGEIGKVQDMSLVSTTLLTPDNQKLIIPNSTIWGGTICNVTALDTRRVDLVIGVGYGDDLDKVQAILTEVAAAHPLTLDNPGLVVKVHNLGDSAVDFVVRPWTKTGDYWDVYWDLTKTIKQRLDAEGVSIPFPQRDLHLIEVPEKMALSS